MTGSPEGRILGPLTALCVVVALVAIGFAQGWWWANLHNGLLALAFAAVGTTVLFERPGHRLGRLFLLVGAVEAAMFLGRQLGHQPDSSHAWWGWLGVWPVGLSLGLVTWCVLAFPEGRFLTRAWHRVGLAALTLGAALSVISALWPVQYAALGITSAPPFDLVGAATAQHVFDRVAHPSYFVLQIVWVLGLGARWRESDGLARRQLLVVVGAAAVSLVGLVAGLVVNGSPTPGLVLATLVPVASGWAIDRLSLAKVIEQESQAGHLEGLTPRENEVLHLMAQGLSNNAISARLHLSIKTVEPIVSSIFVKLGLPSDPDSNRRVLAVMRYLSGQDPSGGR